MTHSLYCKETPSNMGHCGKIREVWLYFMNDWTVFRHQTQTLGSASRGKEWQQYPCPLQSAGYWKFRSAVCWGPDDFCQTSRVFRAGHSRQLSELGTCENCQSWALATTVRAGHSRQLSELGTRDSCQSWALATTVRAGHSRQLSELGTRENCQSWALATTVRAGHLRQLSGHNMTMCQGQKMWHRSLSIVDTRITNLNQWLVRCYPHHGWGGVQLLLYLGFMG